MNAPPSVIQDLRDRNQRIEGVTARGRSFLPFGIPEIDAHLPGGGLALNALHEVAGGGNGAIHGAAAQFFAASIAARTKGEVLWCYTRRDLFAPALHQVGLTPDRLTYFEAGDEKALLACVEEAIRHGGLGAVVAEVGKMSLTASRRLSLAAETSGTMGLVVRRYKRPADAAEFGQPTAAMTRWRISRLQSEALPVPGVGRGRWQLELLRVRAGECADFVVEAGDEQGFITLASDMADRQAMPEAWTRRALS